jgi:hypothetical protein
MTTDETRSDGWGAVFHHGTFFIVAIGLLFVVFIALSAGGDPRPVVSAYLALCLTPTAWVLLLASAYLWVHRDK